MIRSPLVRRSASRQLLSWGWGAVGCPCLCLHGHTGVLTIEVEDTIEPGVNMVFLCNEIQKTA